MTSSYLVDPEIRPLLDHRYPPVHYSSDTLVEIRKAREALHLAALVPANLNVSLQILTVPGTRNSPPVRLLFYRPAGVHEVLPAFLHIHGGGYFLGSPELADVANCNFSEALQCAIFSVDYRLAPEAPYPGPLQDCYAALSWIHDNAAALGIDPARIGVKGESAGGGLAAALALLARDRGEVPLAFQHLIFPMIDDRTCVRPDPHPYTGEFVWTLENNRFGWSALLGHAPGETNVPPYAAAARAENLEGLPPAFIAVGALDLFLEEDMEYARRLTRAGVPVELHVYPGAFHGFQADPAAHVSMAALRDSTDALRRAFHPFTVDIAQ